MVLVFSLNECLKPLNLNATYAHMFTCKNCGSSTSMQTIQCPYCGLISENEAEKLTSEIEVKSEPQEIISAEPVTLNKSNTVTKKLKPWTFIEATFNNWNTSLKEMALLHLLALILSIIPIVAIIIILLLSFSNLMSGDLSFLLNYDFTMLPGEIAQKLFFILAIVITIVLIFQSMALISSLVILSRKQNPSPKKNNLFLIYFSSIKLIPGFALYTALLAGVLVLFTTMLLALRLHEISYFLTFLLISVFIFFIFSRTIIAIAIMVIEKQNIFKSIISSYKLTKGKTFTIIGAVLTFSLIYLGISIGITTMSIIPILGQLVFLISQLFLYPLYPAFIYSIYDLTKKIDNKIEKI